MSDKELLTAIRGIIAKEIKPIETNLKSEISGIKEELKTVNEKLDKHDIYFDSIFSDLGQIKQKGNVLEKKVDLIGTRQNQQFKFLVTELGQVKGTTEEMTGGYYV